LIFVLDDSLLLPQSPYVPVGGAECGFDNFSSGSRSQIASRNRTQFGARASGSKLGIPLGDRF
ncbi:hypothetical protein QUA56_33735, partial [Microcoleus sp. N3A4]|uniref:hypothetical protein n=1 Tax=Microcoleus sp. N3A4 TaxID=3055379 RepID=UPI002FD6F555